MENINMIFYFLLLIVLIVGGYFGSVAYQKIKSKEVMLDNSMEQQVRDGKKQKAVFAGGCFWCTEASFNPEYGVVSAVSGFFGGTTPNPTYENHGDHREGVLVYFNNASTSYPKLLVNYWKHIDPTQADGQFADIGESYKTAIYYFNDEQKRLADQTKKILEDSKKFGDEKITVEILDGTKFEFFPAEEYHQDYAEKNPVRYEYFKKGSGRSKFIHDNWDNDQTFTEFIKVATEKVLSSGQEKISGSGEINRTDTPTPEIFSSPSTINVWQSFNSEIKAKNISLLSPLQKKVTQDEGTEPPFKNEYDKNYEKGIYVDVVSGEPLFLSTDKYDSGTGWPSFVKPINESVVNLKTDYYLFYPRTEVRSKIADSHLGHVFDDGPVERGGKRYCMNSAALKFIPLSDMPSSGYSEFVGMIK